MIALTLDNSLCRIQGLSLEHLKALRRLLSYKVDHFSGGQTKFLLSKRGDYPTGLHYLVAGYLHKHRLPPSVKDNRKRPEPRQKPLVPSLGHAPYHEQQEAAEACRLTLDGRGIVVAPTGVGKSLIVTLIIAKLQVNTLVIVPTVGLRQQLTESLVAAYGPEMVGRFKDKKPIAVDNVDALSPSTDMSFYQCVIIDEFHHSGAASYRALNKRAWNKIYYRFGLTATPFRSQDNERLLLESVISKVIYQIDYRTAVAKGYIVPIEVYFYDIPTTTEIKGDPFSWPKMYSELVVYNGPRNDLISGILRRLKESGVSALCLTKEVVHGEGLAALSGVPFASGVDNNSQELVKRFNACDIEVLAGTDGVLGEGRDTRPCEYVIIAGLGKSRNALMQKAGRGVRRYSGKESCKVILFRDISHKWTLQHFNAQVRVFKQEYGVIPVKLIYE